MEELWKQNVGELWTDFPQLSGLWGRSVVAIRFSIILLSFFTNSSIKIRGDINLSAKISNESHKGFRSIIWLVNLNIEISNLESWISNLEYHILKISNLKSAFWIFENIGSPWKITIPQFLIQYNRLEIVQVIIISMFFCTQLNFSASYLLENTRQYKIKLATLQIKVPKYTYRVFKNSSNVVSRTKYADVTKCIAYKWRLQRSKMTY